MAMAPPALTPRTAPRPDGERITVEVLRKARWEGDPREPFGKRECTPDEILVAAILERSAADVGWLAWGDGKDAVVVPGAATSFLNPSAIGEFPEPPRESVVIDRGRGDGPWALWCLARGILSCAVSPIFARGKVVGVIGLASCRAGALADYEVDRLQLVSSLAVHARTYEARLAGVRRMFDEFSSTLENALALDRALRLPPTYREIARSVGDSLDASYCQIVIHDAKDALTIRGLGGHRPPRKAGIVAWPLAELPHCAQALRERHGVVLKLSHYDPAFEPERLALFSSTTKVGVILPFFAGPRTQGLLIIGEERRSRCQPMSPERVAILELVASRIAHILRMSRRLEYDRLAERRRERRTTIERQHLARELHDEIGQALSGLLVQIRCAMEQGHAGTTELQVLERAACSALDGARALAYGFRHLERGIGPLEHARSFSETLLRAAGCRLSWTEDRANVKVSGKIVREVARAVKESVSNIVRHAHATRVRIRLEYPDGLIRVTIHDDGVGFTPHEVRPARDGRGLGLVGNAERLARVGGIFDVRSSPHGGTLVLLEVPRL
jgi:signal transduction histidine kinase